MKHLEQYSTVDLRHVLNRITSVRDETVDNLANDKTESKSYALLCESVVNKSNKQIKFLLEVIEDRENDIIYKVNDILKNLNYNT